MENYTSLFGVKNISMHTVCPRSRDSFYLVNYYIKWVTTSWTHRTIYAQRNRFFFGKYIRIFLFVKRVKFTYIYAWIQFWFTKLLHFVFSFQLPKEEPKKVKYICPSSGFLCLLRCYQLLMFLKNIQFISIPILELCSSGVWIVKFRKKYNIE